MTPEKKSESIVNLPPKIKKAIAGGIVAASLVTGCNVAVEALPHEKPIITSTSVPTKDPETNTDPTQATYELTPTQKATDTMINPPTLTPEPTATATETPTPTEVEKYPIDLEKLHNFPESYEYLVAHPEEFVEAPNPLEDIEFFNQWWNEKFIPILGDRSEREKNMIMGGGGVLGDFYDIMGPIDGEKPLQGQPEMLFFEHKGVTYPIAIINVGYEEDPHANFTMAIILIKEDEFKAIESLNNGDKINMMRIYIMEKSNLPEVFKELIAAGIVGKFSEKDNLIFGPGLVITSP